MRHFQLLGSLLAIALPLAAPAFAAPATSGAMQEAAVMSVRWFLE